VSDVRGDDMSDVGMSDDTGSGSVASCAGCPGAFVRDVLRDAGPEATLHLVTATRELLLAFETVLRAAEQSLQRESAAAAATTDAERAPRRPNERVRHIDIA
jgi:hypothetical protein